MGLRECCKARFEPVVEAVRELESRDRHIGECPVIIGIDGMCATGKTTLGYYLTELFDCNLFHMDDFFLRPRQRTRERLEEIGGNVDYERFLEEVLTPVMQKRAVQYRPYDCHTGEIRKETEVPYRRLNVIEGSYSLHPYFGDCYDLRIFTESTEERQLRNIRERNGEKMLERFVQEWIPKENAYFEKYRIRENCMIVPWNLQS